MRAMDRSLAGRARAWIEDDPDPGDREELAALLERGEERELADRFRGRLAFGTAGLRGRLRAGPNGMNRAVVRRAAAGLGAWLGPGRSVVVGHDARHRSRAFAEDAAAVLAGAGLRVHLLPRALPTPVLAFAVRSLAADAGVMVTASHNPPQDNGMKVYLGGADGGAQIVPPADREIEAAIAAVRDLAGLPLGAPGARVGDDLVEAYVAATAALALTGDRDVRVAYTPLHGVGRATLAAVLARAGVPAPAVVAAQAEPDPDFPTVGFPNPEEPGAMDAVVALGRETGADVTIANDPDADRCAVAVGDRVLGGDELGALLADHVLRHAPGPVATTIVSSSLLGRMAAAHGVPFTQTLTGFKWIVRAREDLVFGYEEALGYAAGPRVVRDKDGISAALLVAELAAGLRAQGRTLLDRLDDLAREHGVHLTEGLSVRVEDLAVIEAAMARLRAAPPARLAGRAVVEVRDLLAGDGDLPPSDVLVLRLEGARVVVRPSGTEPKLKAYLEAVAPVRGGDLAAARESAARLLRELRGAVAQALGLAS
jgi:phosphomannomutase